MKDTVLNFNYEKESQSENVVENFISIAVCEKSFTYNLIRLINIKNWSIINKWESRISNLLYLIKLQ